MYLAGAREGFALILRLVGSEGEMFRLLVEGHHVGRSPLPIPLTGGSRWYCEARLVSLVQPLGRGDPLCPIATSEESIGAAP